VNLGSVSVMSRSRPTKQLELQCPPLPRRIVEEIILDRDKLNVNELINVKGESEDEVVDIFLAYTLGSQPLNHPKV
jgi:hypothetical protein